MGLTVDISGRLGGDPEVKYTPKGTPVTNVSVACDEYRDGARVTDWHKCVFFGKTAERAAQVLKKGSVVSLLAGKVSSREYEGKTYISYQFNDFTLLASPPKGSGDSRQRDLGDDDAPF